MSRLERQTINRRRLKNFRSLWKALKRFDKKATATRIGASILREKMSKETPTLPNRSPTREFRRATTGAYNAGTVSFQSQGDNQTNVTLQLEYEHEGFFETVGSALDFVDNRVEGNLERFKTFIESRGRETGAQRGKIHGSQVEDKG